jgi:hypothetical protein
VECTPVGEDLRIRALTAEGSTYRSAHRTPPRPGG